MDNKELELILVSFNIRKATVVILCHVNFYTVFLRYFSDENLKLDTFIFD